jgi:hypothetical protein
MQHWGKVSIKQAICDWVRIYGEPPRMSDWNGLRRPEGYPCASTVKYHFGSFGAAIAAAGFQPWSRGARSHRVPSLRHRANGQFAATRESPDTI